MRVFVTGGTGFVGKPTVRGLVEGGHEVRCLVRRSSSTGELEELGCELAHGDVTDRASVLEGMQGCEWAVNLANVYSFWEPDKSVYRRVNVEGTRNVMEAALEAAVSKVAHVSTFVVWGRSSAQGPFDEETPMESARFTEYAQSKYEGTSSSGGSIGRGGCPSWCSTPARFWGRGTRRRAASTCES